MPSTVVRSDPRFPIASRTRNARFPASPEQLPGRVQFCVDAEDVARTLQQTIDAGLRPTVRSSGHCYEDFIVNNPNGAILDVSALNRVTAGPGGAGPYTLGPGTMLGQAYEQLFKLGNVCIPGGNCYTVTAGGHVSGGGYGTLARMHGLTVDWLSAVDIVTVEKNGKAILRRVDRQHDPRLFRALRGGQGSNFGIITAFHFAELPPMPEEVAHAGIAWDWNSMTEDHFIQILTTYGNWMEKNSPKRETWGLFGALHITNKEDGRLSVGADYMAERGPVKDLSVLNDLLDQFARCLPASAQPQVTKSPVDANNPQQRRRGPEIADGGVCYGERQVRRQSWLEWTIAGQSGAAINFADRARAKYKSCYMKKNFKQEEAQALYRVFSGDNTRGLILAVDSYGGAVNNPERALDTAVPQRSSVMKLQYQTYWRDIAEDEYRLGGIREAYTQTYSTAVVSAQHKGTPFPGEQYEGCYINYPDADMLKHEFWPQLYYGTGDTYPMLQSVKREYDPHNIFHHAMSVRS